jgi:hypothetical protein
MIAETFVELRKVIRAVRSSPQRRQHWYNIISPQNIIARVHMLILDVKTRWSSTHQMMSTFFPSYMLYEHLLILFEKTGL